MLQFSKIIKIWVIVNNEALPWGFPETVNISCTHIDAQFPAFNKRFNALSQGISWKSASNIAVPAINRIKKNQIVHPSRSEDEFTIDAEAPAFAFAVERGKKGYPLQVVKHITGSGQVAIKGDRRCATSPDLDGKQVYLKTPAIVNRALVTQNDKTVDNVILYLAGYFDERRIVATIPVVVRSRADLKGPKNSVMYPDRISIRFPYRTYSIQEIEGNSEFFSKLNAEAARTKN